MKISYDFSRVEIWFTQAGLARLLAVSPQNLLYHLKTLKRKDSFNGTKEHFSRYLIQRSEGNKIVIRSMRIIDLEAACIIVGSYDTDRSAKLFTRLRELILQQRATPYSNHAKHPHIIDF